MKYLMLVCRDPSIELTPVQRATIGPETEAWVTEMDRRGVRVQGQELAGVQDATTIRVRHKIEHAGIPYRVPPAHLLPERTGGVLAVLYLMFNEGYAASTGDELIRVDLCAEAIRLARVLSRLMPDDPESGGLLALLLFQHSRREARTDPSGDVITLEEQDRSRWKRAEIDEANAILDVAVRRNAIGPYQVQALIAACHANAPHAGATDWPRIAALYERLLEVTANPLVKLNHAVAVGMATGPEDALGLSASSKRQAIFATITSCTRPALISCAGWTGTPKPRTHTGQLLTWRAPSPSVVT